MFYESHVCTYRNDCKIEFRTVSKQHFYKLGPLCVMCKIFFFFTHINRLWHSQCVLKMCETVYISLKQLHFFSHVVLYSGVKLNQSRKDVWIENRIGQDLSEGLWTIFMRYSVCNICTKIRFLSLFGFIILSVLVV